MTGDKNNQFNMQYVLHTGIAVTTSTDKILDDGLEALTRRIKEEKL